MLFGALLTIAGASVEVGRPEQPGMKATPAAAPAAMVRRPDIMPAPVPVTPVAAPRPAMEPDAGPARTDAAAKALETQTGSASFYANSLAGRKTASGEPYDPRELVAAHRTLPFGTVLRVTNLANDRSVTVRVVDRGPFARGRILDLSRRAAEQIGMIRRGHAPVKVEVLTYGKKGRRGAA